MGCAVVDFVNGLFGRFGVMVLFCVVSLCVCGGCLCVDCDCVAYLLHLLLCCAFCVWVVRLLFCLGWVLIGAGL